MSSSILALNTSPSLSSKVSPRLLPARAELGACAAAFALGSLVWAGGAGADVLPPPAGLSRRTETLARPLLLFGGGS